MGGSSTPPPVVIDRSSQDTAMLKFLEQQNQMNIKNQQAAREAEQRALAAASSTAAEQAGLSGRQAASQMLGLQNQYQMSKDAQRMADYQRAMGMAGAAVTGGPYDVNAARQAQMQNLAPGVGTVIPILPANVSDAAKMINRANIISGTGKPGQSPGVKFGGA